MKINAPEMKVMQWRSRRGLLELDLLLEPFARRRLPALSPAELRSYARLLEAEDPDLLAWFRCGQAPDPAVDKLLKQVLDFAENDH